MCSHITCIRYVNKFDTYSYLLVCIPVGGYFTAGVDSKLVKTSILHFCSEVSVTVALYINHIMIAFTA